MQTFRGKMRRFLYSLLAMLILLPLPILIEAVTPCRATPLLIPLLGLGVMNACFLCKGKWRLLICFAGIASLAGAGAFVLPGTWLACLIPAACAVVILFSIRFANPEEYTRGIILFGIAIYLISAIVSMPKNGRLSSFDAACVPLFAAFCVTLIVSLFSLNVTTLDGAAAAGKNVPAGMRRRNLFLTGAFTVLVFAAASLPQAAVLLNSLFSLCVTGIAAVARMLVKLFTAEEIPPDGGGGAPSMGGLGAEASESSAFWAVMEKIMTIFALLLIAVLLVLFLRILWKKSGILWKKLKTFLARYTAAASEDYVDEVADTREEQKGERSSVLHSLRDLFPEDTRSLSPAQLIRRQYRKMKLRHRDWSDSSTARDTLRPDMASLYEKARYSSQKVTKEEAERFRELGRHSG